MANALHSTQFQPLPTVGLIKSGRCYILRLDAHEVLVDPTNKGKPGDVVVLWPKMKAPVVCRRLARVVPYPGEADGPAPLSDRGDPYGRRRSVVSSPHPRRAVMVRRGFTNP